MVRSSPEAQESQLGLFPFVAGRTWTESPSPSRLNRYCSVCLYASRCRIQRGIAGQNAARSEEAVKTGSCSEATISCGFSTSETRSPLTMAPVGFQEASWPFLHWEAFDNAEGTPWRKEHPERGPSRLSCGPCHRSGNSSRATTPEIYPEPVEFCGRAKAVCLNGFIKYLQNALTSILKLKGPKKSSLESGRPL